MRGSGYTDGFTGNHQDHPAARCSKCGGRNDRAPQRYCSGCHAAYQREWRAGNYITPFERAVIRWLREHAL